MIRLGSPVDYPKLDGVHPLVRQHIINHINGLLSEYGGCDLSEVGTVIFISTESELSDFKGMGLSRPLEEMQNEFAEILILKSSANEIRLIHTVFIISDSWRIDLYIPENLCPDTLREHLYKEFTGEKLIELEEC